MTVHTVERARTGAGAGRPPTASAVVISRALLATIVLVSSIAPLATDMYVPAFPRVGDDLLAGATQVQLTLTTFFVGMALSQLVGGPVSDARGRRMPLLLSLAVLALASVACAVSPSIQLMMVARFVQGLSGGWAMVTARAVVVDLAEGPPLVRSLNIIAGVGGIAPIVGPLAGAAVLQLTHWRVSFWVVALLGALMLLAAPPGCPSRFLRRCDTGVASPRSVRRRATSPATGRSSGTSSSWRCRWV